MLKNEAKDWIIPLEVVELPASGMCFVVINVHSHTCSVSILLNFVGCPFNFLDNSLL